MRNPPIVHQVRNDSILAHEVAGAEHDEHAFFAC